MVTKYKSIFSSTSLYQGLLAKIPNLVEKMTLIYYYIVISRLRRPGGSTRILSCPTFDPRRVLSPPMSLMRWGNWTRHSEPKQPSSPSVVSIIIFFLFYLFIYWTSFRTCMRKEGEKVKSTLLEEGVQFLRLVITSTMKWLKISLALHLPYPLTFLRLSCESE